MGRWTRRDVGYAILFSVPPGVGIAGFVTALTGDGPLGPLAVAVGAATTVVVFVAMLVLLSGGTPDDGRDGHPAED